MKEVFKKVLLFGVLTMIISGCTMKTDMKMTISKDKNIEVSLVSAMDDEMIDALISMGDSFSFTDENQEETNKTYTDEERWSYLESDDSSLNVPEGFTSKRYSENGFKGFVSTKVLGDIDSLSASSANERVNIVNDYDENEPSYFTGTLFIKNGNKYISNMTIDLAEETEEMNNYKSYGAVFESNLVIELPVKVGSNNATKVSADGKTLTWDLLNAKDIEFEFELEEDKSVASTTGETTQTVPLSTVLGIAGATAAVVLAIVFIVVVILNKKQK